jgi:cohesin complex subunit SCC1
MFFSQIILAKKGALGQVWLAAHYGDKKLNRPAISATDIGKSVDSICHSQVPLALRLSAHLLLGVVRIYSRKVKYLMNDAHEAMVQIKMAFRAATTSLQASTAKIDLLKTNGNNNTDGGVEYQDIFFDQATGFHLPFDIDDETNAQDWEPVSEHAAAFDTQTQQMTFLTDNVDTSSLNINSSPAVEAEEQWGVFDPEDEEETVSDIEVTRAVDQSGSTNDPNNQSAQVRVLRAVCDLTAGLYRLTERE